MIGPGGKYDRDCEQALKKTRGRTLEDVRAELPGGLYRLDRSNVDPTSVVETWV